RPGHLVVKTIQLFRLFALFLKPESFWHGHLHTKRKLVGFNTCFQFRITRILYRRNSIEATQHLEFTLLLLLIYTWPGRIKRQWLLTLSVQVYARVFRTQIACTPAIDTTANIQWRCGQGHKGRKILVQRTQSVMHPGADGRQVSVENVPS